MGGRLLASRVFGDKVSYKSPLFEDITDGPKGGWIINAHPKALLLSGTDNVVIGYIRGDNGNAELIEVSDRSGKIGTTFDLGNLGVPDQHSTPTFIERADGKILVIYCAHNDTQMRVRLSSSASTISTLGSASNIASALGATVANTYTQPSQLTGVTGSPIFLFWRSDTGTFPGHVDAVWSFSSSSNGVTGWATKTDWYKEPSRGGYAFSYKTSPNRIDISVYNGTPTDQTNIGIYHCYFDGTNFRKTDGTIITATKPFSSSAMTQVFAGTGVRSIAQNVVLGSDGHPRISYNVITSDNVIDTRVGRWTGSAWSNETVTGGLWQPEDTTGVRAGGATLADESTLYVSKAVDGIMEIFMYKRQGDGTWLPTQITSKSSTHQTGPYVPVNASKIKVIWETGDSASDLAYSVGVRSARRTR